MKRLVLVLILTILLTIAACGQPVPIAVKPVIEYPEYSTTPDYKNMTKLVIQPKFKHLRLGPGDSKTFTIKVKNPTDKDVLVNPEIIQPPFSEYLLEEDWVQISEDFTLKPSEEKEIEVTVKIPENAIKGYYSCTIALTNDSYSYRSLPNYINSIILSVNVWVPPAVKIYPRFIDDVVEAGKSYTYRITVENTGNREIKLDPSLYEEYYDPWRSTFLTKDMVSIESPSKISPNSKTEVVVKVNIPSDAKGYLHGSIDLGIDDPTIDEWMQRVNMNLRIYHKPTEPYVKEVMIENASMLKIEVSSSNYRKAVGDFEVRIKSPNGYIDMKPSKIMETIRLTLSGDILPPWEEAEGIYKVMRYEKSETYTIENPTNGVWKVEVFPECDSFTVKVEIE